MQRRQSRANSNNFTISIKKGEKISDLQLKRNTPVGKCPICGEDLVIRNGKNGTFIGCKGFKKGCKQTYNIKGFKARNNLEILGSRKGFEINYSLILLD